MSGDFSAVGDFGFIWIKDTDGHEFEG